MSAYRLIFESGRAWTIRGVDEAYAIEHGRAVAEMNSDRFEGSELLIDPEPKVEYRAEVLSGDIRMDENQSPAIPWAGRFGGVLYRAPAGTWDVSAEDLYRRSLVNSSFTVLSVIWTAQARGTSLKTLLSFWEVELDFPSIHVSGLKPDAEHLERHRADLIDQWPLVKAAITLALPRSG